MFYFCIEPIILVQENNEHGKREKNNNIRSSHNINLRVCICLLTNQVYFNGIRILNDKRLSNVILDL